MGLMDFFIRPEPVSYGTAKGLNTLQINRIAADLRTARDKVNNQMAKRELLEKQREAAVKVKTEAEEQLGVFGLVQILLQKTSDYARQQVKVRIEDIVSEELHEIKERISKFLDEELQLALNKKTCIRPVSMGIQFVGLHIWSTHRTVRKSTSLRIKRRLKAAAKQYVAGNLTYERYNSTLQSYMGMMKHNDCYRFKMQLLEDVETIINESGVAA